MLHHDAFGIPFNSFSERFEKLEEALNIILPMLRGDRPTLDGVHYQVTEAINSPAPLSKIPVMIGGAGEKKTLRMVAQYADESNLICSNEEIPRKLDALAAHCERLGRDRSEIKVTKLLMLIIGRTHDDAMASAEAFVKNHGWPPAALEAMAAFMTLGGPDEIGEAVREMAELGIDGVTLNLAANAHDPEMNALASEVVMNRLTPCFDQYIKICLCFDG